MLAAILKTADQVDAAPAGMYVTRSGLEAYFPVKARIEVGQAYQHGEVFDELGRHVILVELGPNANTLHGYGFGEADEPEPLPDLETMQVDPKYFSGALRDYREWYKAWWREAVQNSVDAGATQIDLTIQEQPDGTFVAACDDNGRGMDAYTLVNKFLMMGATSKEGQAGSTGGFGKAKELLILPWIGWQVFTRDIRAYGAGNSFRREAAPARLGTRLEVVMPADKHTREDYAIGFIRRCFLPHIQFTVNGKPVAATLHGGFLLAEVPNAAQVFFIENKSHDDYQPWEMYVRINGIWMFDQYVGRTPGQLIVELTAPSTAILMSNRDRFREDSPEGALIALTLNELATKIAKDSSSALENKAGLIRKKYKGAGKFRAKRDVALLLDRIGSEQTEFSQDSLGAIKRLLVDLAEPVETIASFPSTVSALAMLDQDYTGAAHKEAALQQLVWQPDFYLANDIADWKVPKKFYPEYMTPRVFKLAKTWTELVRYVLMQLGSDKPFGVGFIFSDKKKAQALFEESADGKENWVMLNPFKSLEKYETPKEGEEIYSPAQNADLKWLYALAIHECTHVANNVDDHDEEFASAMTQNMAICADGYRKIRQIANGIKSRGGIKADVDD